MATINDNLQDGFIAHQIEITKLSSYVAAEIKRRLRETEDAANVAISSALPKLTGQASRRQNAAMQDLEKSVAKARGRGISAAGKWHEKEAEKLIQAEFSFIPEIINDAMPFTYEWAIPRAAVESLAAYATFEGMTLRQWYARLEAGDVARIMQAVRLGVSAGQTTNQIIEAVKGVYKTTENGAEMLARTVTNGLANSAKKEFYTANADVIAAEVYTATLDARTSAVCRSLDGKRYEVGKGPYPPLHPNCRSTRVPVVDGEELIGDRPSVGGTNFRNAARKTAGPKWKRYTAAQKTAAANRERKKYGKEIFGSVPAKTNYEQFLKRQPVGFQDEVLGKTKAKLWRDGKLEFSQMIDSRTYKPLTLAEIKKRYGVG